MKVEHSKQIYSFFVFGFLLWSPYWQWIGRKSAPLQTPLEGKWFHKQRNCTVGNHLLSPSKLQFITSLSPLTHLLGSKIGSRSIATFQAIADKWRCFRRYWHTQAACNIQQPTRQIHQNQVSYLIFNSISYQSNIELGNVMFKTYRMSLFHTNLKSSSIPGSDTVYGYRRSLRRWHGC